MIGSEFGITGRQVKRYIRLTYLIPELLELLDMKKLTFINAVDISFFAHQLLNRNIALRCSNQSVTS